MTSRGRLHGGGTGAGSEAAKAGAAREGGDAERGPGDREIKFSCCSFYESEAVRAVLGDVLHPGGLALTYRVGRLLELGPADRVLDVACGRGKSAVHLAERFGCRVTGLDYSAENVCASEATARERGVADLTSFRRGDAEGLPFDDSSFDAVLSECSFCTFPNKKDAAAEMARVLRAGGRLGLADVTLKGALPGELRSLLSWVSCLGGAASADEYLKILSGAGFGGFAVEDHGGALAAMAGDVKRRLSAVGFMAGLGKLDLGPIDLREAGRLLDRALELIGKGTVGYVTIAGVRG